MTSHSKKLSTAKQCVEEEAIAISKVFNVGEADIDINLRLWACLTQARFREVFGIVLPNLPETINIDASVLSNPVQRYSSEQKTTFPVQNTLKMEIYVGSKVLYQLQFDPSTVPSTFLPVYELLVELGKF